MKGNFWYSESQGISRDKEILAKYEIIIKYFEANPQRIQDNEETLRLLYYNDIILNQNENLNNRLIKMLNSESAKRAREKVA
jgi:hypothetical protein